jgi:hypothetical protein
VSMNTSNGDGLARRPGAGLEAASLGDGADGLSRTPITRAQALKLVGAAAAGTAITLIWPGEADADARSRRRRRRRRRKRRAVTSNPSTVNFGDTTVGAPVTRVVEITNDGNTDLFLRPELVGDNFSIADAGILDGFNLEAGETIEIPVIFTPDILGNSEGLLNLVVEDGVDDGLVVEKINLLGRGII